MTTPGLTPEQERRLDEIRRQMTLDEKVSLLSGLDSWHTVPIERVGLPSLVMTDGPHGVRAPHDPGRINGPATSFPTGVAMAASWNPELIEQVGRVLAEETRAMGCDILLGPCVNIVRHPLAGRNFESYAEDPYLAGRMAAAYIKGLQSKGAGASLKHFACNSQETERFRGSSEVDERALREIYLPAFETAVMEARPWTVMCSYNRLNGVYASQNRHLLQEILKGEWGFAGAVISDWGANHTTVESAAGGLDLEMPGPAKHYGRLLAEAVKNGQIDAAIIDESVRRLLRLLFLAGKLDGSTPFKGGAVNTPEHQRLAGELAEDSIVLLKNDGGLLPIRPCSSIVVLGPNAIGMQVSGGGSACLEPPYRVDFLAGLRARLAPRCTVGFEPGCDNWVDPPVLEGEYLAPEQGQGHGLWGEYYRETEPTGEAVLARVDRKIDFWWWSASPDRSMDGSRFSVRWTGRLMPKETGRHILKVSHTGCCRVYLDGVLKAESKRKGPHDEAFLVGAEFEAELTAGRVYDLKVEYIKPAAEELAVMRLFFGYSPRLGEDGRLAKAVALARDAELAIVCAGMSENYETEGADRPDLELPGCQNELIEAVAKANPKTIVVLNCGAPVTMPWLAEVPAVVLAHYPGQEGGNALARILTGEVNPSGRLPVTWPRRLQDTPAYLDYPGGREVRYGEGIFVGYRWYDRRDIEPLFPFGHGLSYTSFEYLGIEAPPEAKIGEPVQFSVTVKNTGPRPGREIVQIYVADLVSSAVRPPKELKAFAKVALEPGEVKTVGFTLAYRSFAFYDPHRSDWVVEPGEFELLAGSSVREIKARTKVKLA